MFVGITSRGNSICRSTGPRNNTDCVRDGVLGGPFIKNLLTLILDTSLASLVAQRVKRLPEMYETWVRSLGQEDPLEKEMATHSSTLAWKTPLTEEPGGLQSMGSQRVGHD